MKITSTAFKHNGFIPNKYTCDGENINPPLTIEGKFENIKSYALIVDDPDATSGVYVHWVLWNINSDIKIINEKIIPKGAVEGKNSANTNGYMGPCPPSGVHRYYFKIFALDIMLDLNSDSTADDLINEIQGHIIDSAELMGLYTREK